MSALAQPLAIVGDVSRGRRNERFPASAGAQLFEEVWRASPDDAVRIGQAMDAWLSGPDGAGMLVDLQGHPALVEHLPELAITDGFEQDTPWHPEGDLYLHIRQVTERLVGFEADPDLRWAAVLHDLGKPDSKWFGPEGNAHYYENRDLGKEAHEVIGARMARQICPRLGLSAERSDRICHLVRHHMFQAFSTERGARRFVERVGARPAQDLLLFRQADWEASGDPVAFCDGLRALISRSMEPPDKQQKTVLAIDGGTLIAAGIVAPGPAVGPLIAALRRAVADEAVANQRDALLAHARGLA